MEDLFGIEQHEIKMIRNKSGSFNFNPCIPVYGAGPDNTKCKTCIHLYGKSFSKVYYKCKLRGNSNGPSTDHRVNWPSCGKYEKEPDNNK